MLKEATTSLKAYLYDRNTSPMFGAFIVSWAFWNYQAVITFFAAMGQKDKLDWFTQYYSEVNKFFSSSDFAFELSNQVLVGALYPLLTATIYIFVLPYPSKFVFEFNLRRQQDLNNLKHRVEETRTFDSKEIDEIKKSISENEGKFLSELQIKDNIIAQKDKKITEISEEASSLSADNSRLNGELDESQRNLGELSGSIRNSDVEIDEFRKFFNKNRVLISKLHNYIPLMEEAFDSGNDYIVTRESDFVEIVNSTNTLMKEYSQSDFSLGGFQKLKNLFEEPLEPITSNNDPAKGDPSDEDLEHSSEEYEKIILTELFKNDGLKLDDLLSKLPNQKLAHHYVQVLNDKKQIEYTEENELVKLSMTGQSKAVEFMNSASIPF
ncbi:hypothetical protein GCM10007916_30780 [Psychromonas marina]|uniref:Uncharacterized protein n=1 Tax=Psychromonas marina TaxID=88364 RepID=A0ABQ6E4A8_9GAMM|nr:hypothetical protein [Psychromonas marina]GLS92008.1 hypothetical protein GCM10007916_30780 [Psychromonas marina]